jgi:ABC-type transport system substrate-binding protein
MTRLVDRLGSRRRSRLAAVPASRLTALGAAAVLVAGCATPSSSGVTPGVTTPSGAATPAVAVASASSPESTSPPRGGTLRVVIPGDDGSAALRDMPPDFLDPELDVSSPRSYELWRCCLVRTLLSHNGRSAAEGGARLQPDLAAALPEVSADGLTWTFRLKPGLHYGPPLQAVEITADDFVRGFHRLLAPANGSWLLYDYLVIQGAAEYNAGTTATIPGIEAPDAHTLVIRLTKPVGDLGARLATGATGPLPPNPAQPDATTGIAAGADTGYGRFLVSSGPYMLEGSEALDFSVPAAGRKPVAGFAPGLITLVRNPSWDPDSDPLRPAYADRIEITVLDSVDAAVAALDAGTADVLWASGTRSPTVPADVFDAFRADPGHGQAFLDPTGLVRYVMLNVAVPPFDDLHVRKAVTYAIDKQKLVDLSGGSVAQGVYGHLAADILEDDLLADYDPYATPGGHGDLEKARAEMRLSRYDTNGDGRCDVPACTGLRATTRAEFAPVARQVAADLGAIGIGLDVAILELEEFFQTASRPADGVAAVIGMGISADYVSAASIMADWFDSPLAIGGSPDFYNLSMVGATPEQLKRWGYEVAEVPNVDARVEACLPLVGAAQFQCWAGLDQYLMENVVAWVPYADLRYASLGSPRLASYSFDAFANEPALDRLAVRP